MKKKREEEPLIGDSLPQPVGDTVPKQPSPPAEEDPKPVAQGAGADIALHSTEQCPTQKWNAVVAVLNTHYHEPDIQAARALYASVAAHGLQNGQPVWPMIVAPPGSMKTELLRALDGLPLVHSIDGVTSKTFISGQIRDKEASGLPGPQPPSSLLHRIGHSGILTCPDFSTILAIKSDDRNAILADLRRIYDGELRKEFGTSETVPVWRGRITLVAAVTEDIDKHYSVIQSLGDRFVMVRMARAGQEAAIRAMMQDIGGARADLKRTVHALLLSLPPGEPHVPKPMIKQLAALAEFAVRARSQVPRGGPDKSVIGEPQAESATRLAQQLCQLAKGSARLSHRKVANAEDFEIARRVAFDCIPARRRVMLEWAIAGGKIAASSATKKYDREDLQVLGLVEQEHLSPGAMRLLREMAPDKEFTKYPPRASGRIDPDSEVGGTSGELTEDGGAR